jgi:hypothetical protein
MTSNLRPFMVVSTTASISALGLSAQQQQQQQQQPWPHHLGQQYAWLCCCCLLLLLLFNPKAPALRICAPAQQTSAEP